MKSAKTKINIFPNCFSEKMRRYLFHMMIPSRFYVMVQPRVTLHLFHMMIQTGLIRYLFLYYGVHEGKTVGFLSADFYNNEIVDICGYVLPKYRKLNLMSSLLDSFLTDYNDFYISAMLNSKNSTGCAVLSHLGFEKTATEYMMKFSLSSACYKTLPKYVKIVDGNLESTTQSVKFEMVSQGATVGSCLIELFNDRTVCIHDVLVFDKYRGMGYGFKMLDAVISYLSKDHTYVLLHVSGDNKPAISLYKKLGFVVVDSAEIYEM